jgi:chromosome segregation ATPase
MIDIQIPKSKEYDTAHASLLATTLKNLRSFDEIAEWDKKATAEIDIMRSILKTIEDKQQRIVRSLEQEKQEHATKSFLARLFASRKEQKQLLAEQSLLTKEKVQIEGLIDQFESAIDFTPDSPNDLKELIKECKQRKKELQTEKKAVSAQMASIRVEARQRTADSIPGKYGKWDRRQIRLNKESALGPHESEKAGIERQIIKLDQIIVWLERFK